MPLEYSLRTTCVIVNDALPYSHPNEEEYATHCFYKRHLKSNKGLSSATTVRHSPILALRGGILFFVQVFASGKF